MSKQSVFPKTRTTLQLRKRVPLAERGVITERGVERPFHQGYTTVPDGIEELYYETVIDLDALHDLARKAGSNKGGQSKAGPLSVRILSRTKLA